MTQSFICMCWKNDFLFFLPGGLSLLPLTLQWVHGVSFTYSLFPPGLAAHHSGSPSSESSVLCTIHVCRDQVMVTSPNEFLVWSLTSSQLLSRDCSCRFVSLQRLPGLAMYVRCNASPQSSSSAS